MLVIPLGVMYRIEQFASGVVCATTFPVPPGEPPITDTNRIAVPSMTTIVAVFVGVEFARVAVAVVRVIVAAARVSVPVTRAEVPPGFGVTVFADFAVAVGTARVREGNMIGVKVRVILGRVVGVLVGKRVKVGVSVGGGKMSAKTVWMWLKGLP